MELGAFSTCYFTLPWRVNANKPIYCIRCGFFLCLFQNSKSEPKKDESEQKRRNSQNVTIVQFSLIQFVTFESDAFSFSIGLRCVSQRNFTTFLRTEFTVGKIFCKTLPILYSIQVSYSIAHFMTFFSFVFLYCDLLLYRLLYCHHWHPIW